MEMAWPLVSWIMSASSSSSSSSSEYDDNNEDDNEAESPNDDVSCDDSVSPSTRSPCQPPSSTVAAPAAVDANPSSSTSKRRRTDHSAEAVKRVSKRRVWTREDELQLLHGFLDHTTKRRRITNGRKQREYHVSSFYNEVKPDLQLRFNKSQIVDKLRRLKRKYSQNIAKKRSLSLDVQDQSYFKNPHDRATFEISHEIWNTTDRLGTGDQDQTVVDDNVPIRTRSQTRSARLMRNSSGKAVLDDGSWLNKINNSNASCGDEGSDTAGLITGLCLNPVGLMKFGDGEVVNVHDEKWGERQIMELEVYLKRLELVQAQVKAALDKLRSAGSGDL